MSHSSDSLVAHHFEDIEQQNESAVLGMWLFLGQEIMFFGGLFAVYLVYRFKYPDAWAAGSTDLDITLGTFNTVVLLVSSLTMAMGVWSAQTGRQKSLIRYLLATLVLGSTFLVVKFFEYKHKWDYHHVPGPSFSFQSEHFPNAAESNVQLFYTLYFIMTGMHALHMVIGAGLLIWLIVLAWKGKFGPHNFMKVELTGFYWHFVDIVWVFLFPLLYLINRHH
ncbi:MAG: cytochrome c oxidase subunit III [Candidatus Hydrogenedentota bacterium]